MKKLYITAILSLIIITAAAQESVMTGREVMQILYDRPDGDTRYATTEMILIKKNGRQRIRKIKSWGADFGKDSKKIMFFTYPGDVRGTCFLCWEYDDASRTDDKWLYMPALKKTRRISGESSKTDYFMGSDFTYDDMSRRSVDKEKHQLIGNERIDGRDCWVVESIPIEKGEIYTRRISWVAKECLIPVKVEYYDKLDKLHRRMTISEIDQVQGFWTMHYMEMENVQTGHKTVIKMDNQQFDLKLRPNMFTVTTMEKGI